MADDATTTSSPVFFDKAMLRSREVLVKVGEVALLLFGIISALIATYPMVYPGGLFYPVAGGGLSKGVCLIILYVSHLRDRIVVSLKFNIVELVFSLLMAVVCIIVGPFMIVEGNKTHLQGAFMAAGVLMVFAAVLYCVDAFFLYRAWRSGQLCPATRTSQSATRVPDTPDA